MCEKTDGLGIIVKDGVVMEACAECRNMFENTVNEIVSHSSDNGSYFKGAIGAVLGGIIGIIPWVLIDALGYFAAFCGLIMAYFSYKGYRLMKGRKDKGMVFIIAAVLIVFTFFAVILSQTFDIYNAYHGDKSGLSVLNLFGAELVMPFNNKTIYFGEYFLTPDLSAIWTNIGLGFFFAAAGSAVFIKNMFKSASGNVSSVKVLGQSEEIPADDTVPKE